MQEKQTQAPAFRMESLDQMPNPKYKPDPEPKAAPIKKKKKVIRRKRKTIGTGSRSRRTVKKPEASRPVKPLPRSSVSQPRDHLGRFASLAGRAIVGVTKGTVSVVVGGVKTANKVHKTVKRANAASRRRQNIEMRERAVAVHEREVQLGIRSKGKKKKVIRRKR